MWNDGFFSLIYAFGLLLSFHRLNFCHFYVLKPISIEKKQLSQVLQNILFGIILFKAWEIFFYTTYSSFIFTLICLGYMERQLLNTIFQIVYFLKLRICILMVVLYLFYVFILTFIKLFT